MKKVFVAFMFVLLLVGCSKNEVKSSEAVEQIFNTEVIEHSEDVTVPTTSVDETEKYNLGSIVIDETKKQESIEPSKSEVEKTEEESDVESTSEGDDKIVVSATVDDESVPEEKQIELNGRFAISYNDGIYTYQINDGDSLLQDDAFKDVSFFFIDENKTEQYPGTITAVSKYTNDLKEMIVLFYRKATNLTSNKLNYKEVGIKEMTPDDYSESMDIYEEGKQRMRVDVFWDKLNNQPITISLSMIPGTEGEHVEGS